MRPGKNCQLIEKMWKTYRGRHIHGDVPEDIMKQLRVAFYSGAEIMADMMLVPAIAKPTFDPKIHARWIEDIYKEIEEFKADPDNFAVATYRTD